MSAGRERPDTDTSHVALKPAAVHMCHSCLRERLVATNEPAFSTAKQVVTVSVHAVGARLALQRHIQREQRLAQKELVENCELRRLQAKSIG